MKTHKTVVAKKQSANAMPDLSDTEQDLILHLQNGYQLETDSLGGDLLLRGSKDKEAIRPQSATRNTVKALEQRGLIVPVKNSNPLRIVWRLQVGESRSKGKRKRRP